MPLDRPSTRVVPQWCRPAARRRYIHLAGTWLYVGASALGRIADATGIEFGRSSDYGHYVSGSYGTGKSHLAQAIAHAAIHQGHRVLYRETHILLEELAEAVVDGTRKQYMESIASVPLLLIDDFGMRKLPHTAAEDLLEIIMRRYERASTLLTSNRPVEGWGKLLGDVAAVSSMLDRLLHHGHVLKCGPRSWRTKTASTVTGEPS
jgi:DNA replication protein DnaC